MDHRAIILYWERRRWLFLFLLVLPAGLGYLPSAAISAGVGDRHYLTGGDVVFFFTFAFCAANICYTFIYAIEFLLVHTRVQEWYARSRGLFFVAGTVIGIIAAYGTARAIYFQEFGIDPSTGLIHP